MAINVYNTKQQALTANKVAELFSFTSNDFGGLISSIQTPIIFDNNTWYWDASLQNTQIKFMGAGVNISYDVPPSPSEETSDIYPKTFSFQNSFSMWGMDVTIPSENSSIKTNNYELASIIEVECENIYSTDLYLVVNNPVGNPHDKGYYEYSNIQEEYILSEDSSVESGKVYYYKIDREAFKIENAQFSGLNQPITVEYYGNTVWISENRFFIPFCYRDSSGNSYSMIFNRDKSGYESFLSARTYYNILAELGNKFVFRSGGPVLGDIGDLNVTNNVISNKLNELYGVNIQNPIFSNITESSSTSLDNILIINDDSGRIYKANPNYIVPIQHGGTSANEKNDARNNLGFYYGTSDPNTAGLVPTRTNGQVDEYAVYFKIL